MFVCMWDTTIILHYISFSPIDLGLKSIRTNECYTLDKRYILHATTPYRLDRCWNVGSIATNNNNPSISILVTVRTLSTYKQEGTHPYVPVHIAYVRSLTYLHDTNGRWRLQIGAYTVTLERIYTEHVHAEQSKKTCMGNPYPIHLTLLFTFS